MTSIPTRKIEMKTAIELAARLSARYLDTKQMLPDELAHESAAMILQQAEQLSAWLAANGPGGWIDDLRNKCEALEITNDALKADAARYRWLRENINVKVSHWFCTEGGKQLDAAIDAMKGKS